MNVRIRAKFEPVVRKHLKAGDAKTPQEVVDQAMTLLAKHQQRLEKLRRDVQKGIDAAERGDVIRFKSRSELRRFFDDLKARAAARAKPARRSRAA